MQTIFVSSTGAAITGPVLAIKLAFAARQVTLPPPANIARAPSGPITPAPRALAA